MSKEEMNRLERYGFNEYIKLLDHTWGVLPIMAHMGRPCSKGVVFQASSL